jgi:hypothetical protein
VRTGRLAGYQYFLAGAGVGAIATFLSTPFEMVKVQLQLDNVALKQYALSSPQRKNAKELQRKKTTVLTHCPIADIADHSIAPKN